MSASTACIGQKVLLIDDDELIAGSLRQYLAMQGCDVDVAVEKSEAATLMARQHYDVVVVDPFLTGGVHLEGSVLLDSITMLQPDASVIVVTGYGTNDLAQMATAARIPLLTKPQSVVTLSDFIFKGLST
jgi:DNA-binding NtrC family response regulator